MSETRPLTTEESMWAELYGTRLRCATEGCGNEATYSRSVAILPGVTREDFVCEECAATKESP